MEKKKKIEIETLISNYIGDFLNNSVKRAIELASGNWRRSIYRLIYDLLEIIAIHEDFRKHLKNLRVECDDSESFIFFRRNYQAWQELVFHNMSDGILISKNRKGYMHHKNTKEFGFIIINKQLRDMYFSDDKESVELAKALLDSVDSLQGIKSLQDILNEKRT